jgi:hypothetical protein
MNAPISKNTVKQEIQHDLKESLLRKDILRTSTLRMLLAAINNKEIELGRKEEGISNEEIFAVLRTEIKKRKDAAVGFRNGGKEKEAAKEEDEIAIIQEYLPQEISDEEIRVAVKTAIDKSKAVSLRDFGKAMKEVMVILKGKASGERISRIVKEELKEL